jgi:hypothetical protein
LRLISWAALRTIRSRGESARTLPALAPVVTLSLHRDDFVPAVRSRMLLG